MRAKVEPRTNEPGRTGGPARATGWNVHPRVAYLPTGAGQRDTGVPWLVLERQGGQRRDWPIAYPTFEAARDAAHAQRLRLLREEVRGAFARLADEA